MKIEKSNLFTNKNTISMAILTNAQLEFDSNTEKEFNKKFSEHKETLKAENRVMNQCIGIRDTNRFIFYAYCFQA